jgi:hypothetical protein
VDGLSPTSAAFDRPRPSIDSTLSGTSNVTATPTNAAAKFAQRRHAGDIPALNLTTASPIAPRHEVEPWNDELDPSVSHKPHLQLQSSRSSSEAHRPSTPPTVSLLTDAAAVAVDGDDPARVLSNSFMSAQESSLRAAREPALKSKSLAASTSSVPTSVADAADRQQGVPKYMRRTGMGLRREKSLPPVPRELREREDGASSPDILDMIRRGRERAKLMNPHARRRRSTGACKTPGNGSRPPLRRQKTTIDAESRKSWLEYDNADMSLLDDSVSLKSFKAKDGEEKSTFGKQEASLYVVEDDRQGFDFDDDDDGHSSDSSLDLHTPLVCDNFLYSPFQRR